MNDVEIKLETLTSMKLDYSKLTEKDKKIIDDYIELIDFNHVHTIYEFGKEEAEKNNMELDILISILKTHNRKISDMYTELLEDVEKKSNNLESESFLGLLKKFSKRILKDENEDTVFQESQEGEKVEVDLDEIQEKLEIIRNDLLINIKKLQIIAKNSVEQYMNIQYQIIALQEVLNMNKQFDERKKAIKRKIEIWKGISINILNKIVIAKLIASHDEDLLENNELLIEKIETYDCLEDEIYKILSAERDFSRQMTEKVREVLNGNNIDSKSKDTNIEENIR